jgi:hypothetical protein
VNDRVDFIRAGTHEASPQTERYRWTAFAINQVHIHIGNTHVSGREMFVI